MLEDATHLRRKNTRICLSLLVRKVVGARLRILLVLRLVILQEVHFRSISSSVQGSRDRPKFGKSRIRYDKHTTSKFDEDLCKEMVCGSIEKRFAIGRESKMSSNPL